MLVVTRRAVPVVMLHGTEHFTVKPISGSGVKMASEEMRFMGSDSALQICAEGSPHHRGRDL